MQRSMQHPSHSTALRTATTVASSQGETSSYTDVDADGNSCTLKSKVLVLWRALFAALLQAETCVFGCCGVLYLQPCCRQKRVYSDAVACFGCSLAAGRNVCIRMLWRALVAALLQAEACVFECCGVLWLQPCCRQKRVYWMLWRALVAALLQAATCVFECCGVLWLQPCWRATRYRADVIVPLRHCNDMDKPLSA